MRKHNTVNGDHRGGVEEHMGVFGKGKEQRKKYLHNNQIMQNPFAPKLALDLDSIMSGRGNTTLLMGIIEEM